MQTELLELKKSFKDSFELNTPETVSEEELLMLLERRLGILLERNLEEFFQMLYRIDIPENQLHEVLQDSDALSALAKMVYNRQLQKVKSRLKYKASVNNSDIDADLKW